MKFIIALFALVAVASAGYIHAPVAHPWPAPWQAPVHPTYVKAVPAVVKVAVPQVHHAPEVHHVFNVPQQPAIPAPHPHPLNLKAHAHVVRIPYHGAKAHHPHLVGVEAYHQHDEPEIKVVKAAHHVVSHHPWE